MLRQGQIAEVINVQRTKMGRLKGEIEREQLGGVKNLPSFASIITGLRRVGKSTLLKQISLRNDYREVLHLNFDDINLSGFERDDFVRLYQEIQARKARQLFFDEIQLVKGWEVFVHQLLREGYVVYVSGSNATMLSVDLGTHLTGRHLSTELFPFSFAEFLAFTRGERSAKTLGEYLLVGGVPEYVRTRENAVLRSLIDDVLIRDIAVNKGIRNVDSLRQLAVYLLSNIARPYSANNLKTVAGVTAASTVLEYVSYMRNAYLVDSVGLYDNSLKVTARNPKKVYAYDTGLAHSISLSRTPDLGRYFENLVYVALRHRFAADHIYYFQRNGSECDFVLTGGANQPVELIQVCYELTTENFQREMDGLTTAMQELNLRRGTIVTFDEEDRFTTAAGQVDVVKGWKWMG